MIFKSKCMNISKEILSKFSLQSFKKGLFRILKIFAISTLIVTVTDEKLLLIASTGTPPCGSDCARCSTTTENSSTIIPNSPCLGYSFPNLNLPACVTAEGIPQGQPGAYNCIAWSVGITNNWQWLEVDDAGNNNGVMEVSDFNAYYATYGLYPWENCSDSIVTVRLYCKNGTPTHADKKVGSGRFESKLGESIRIRHGSNELEGGPVYGNICKCYAEIAT